MEKVKSEIGEHLKTFEEKFSQSFNDKNKLLSAVLRFIVRRKGKKMRPMFVLLSAKIAGERINETAYRAASMVELLHTATLVHDDVVDNAMMRRGFFSINALWKNKIAVLVGDYLLAKGLLQSVDNEDFEILRITSNAVKEMSEGELLQMEKARKMNIEEGLYFDVIRAKTASLLAAACAAGAYAASSSKEKAETFRLFGEKIGIAFQIRDDLFDYGSDNVGKPTGIDIKEKKMTLPLIHILQKVPADIRKKIIYIVRNQSDDRKKVEEVIAYVQQYGGIDYAKTKMELYRREALAILHGFPPSSARDAMEELVNYAIDRKH